MVSAARCGGSSAVPLCRWEAPPAHGLAPLQPSWHLRGGSSSSQLSAGPLVQAQLSSGWEPPWAVQTPPTAAESCVGFQLSPERRGALSQPPVAPADGLAGLLAPLQQGCWDLLPLPPPRAPLLVLWGLAAAEQGGQHPPLLFLHSRGPRTHRYPMAPEAMVRDALEQAGCEGPVVQAASLGQQHGSSCLLCAALGGSSGRAPARACGYFGNNNGSHDTV